MWNDVKYEPGAMKAVAYNEAGQQAATEEIHAAGPAHHLRLVADQLTLQADGQDLAYVAVRVEDKHGNLCPAAAQQLSFKVSGQGNFRAVAHGDATSREPFSRRARKPFTDNCIVLVQTGAQPGTATRTVSGPGLKRGQVALGVN